MISNQDLFLSHLFDVSVLAVVSRSVGRVVGDAAAAREDRLGRLESLRGERVALADADGLLDGALDEDDADQRRKVLLGEPREGKTIILGQICALNMPLMETFLPHFNASFLH